MKYESLNIYLSSLPKSKKKVSLNFSRIEEIIHASLPKSAFEYQEWWANQSYGPQAKSWQDAGFTVNKVDTRARRVTFYRGKGRVLPSRKSKQKPKNRAVVKIHHQSLLLNAGFQKYGHWEIANGELRLIGSIPSEAGVYAHILGKEIYYVGVAKMGLSKRLKFYAKPGSTQRTSIRINQLIKNELQQGNEVTLLAATPTYTDWNGLPVDLASGLETGLIDFIQPPWNLRGKRK